MRRPVRKRLTAANGDDDPDRLYGAREGHAPLKDPHAPDRAHPSANVKTKVRPRDSRPYIAIMNVRATTPNMVNTPPPCHP